MFSPIWIGYELQKIIKNQFELNIREYSNSFELFKFLPIRVRALYGMVLIYGNEGFTLLMHARPKAARVAGEHSTTEPSMLVFSIGNLYKVYKCYILHQSAAPTVEMRFSSQSLLFQPLELPLH